MHKLLIINLIFLFQIFKGAKIEYYLLINNFAEGLILNRVKNISLFLPI